MKNNNNNNKITLAVVIAAVAILTAQVTALWAQPLSPEEQQIIDGVRAECDRLTNPETAGEAVYSCVSLPHHSPTLVVLGGELLLTGLGGSPIDNVFIWDAVDGFIALGYSIDSVQLTGQGTQDNPHNIMIVMSK